ncbi:ribokinase [Shewanella halifaxensis HAW-EB4]|uniref:Ribokinase n=1 Tax=Shewanella halifaxensis (strain HAW-EB4) TaxID=458817 RepID=B0TS22_SHEHH|nr:ribokinase [Shewanella halifaxensis]ABZ75157.1 ribokinase [Shewanella halifaxensis HAW-EB4]
MSQLIVLGSVNADHVLQVASFPRPGETLHGYNYQIIPGGKGANQAVAAARLGADTGFIACVGDDGFGRNIRHTFEQDGMEVSAVHMVENTPTGIAMIQVADSGENSICIAAAANDALTTKVVEQHALKIEQAQYLLMQLETPLPGIELAASIAKAQGTQVILNPAPARSLPDTLLAMVDIITPNETEAELLTGVAITDADSAAQAAKVLHDKGIVTVMITLGSKGVYLSEQGEGKIIAGFKVQVTDTTAAGDTFNGAFVTALLEGQTIDKAIVFAHAAAAISVTRFGAQTSIPTREEVEQFLAAH